MIVYYAICCVVYIEYIVDHTVLDSQIDSIDLKVRHPCDQCDMAFTRNTELDRHRRAVHGDSAVPSRYSETFECDKCGFTTPYPKSFERHQNRMYSCDRWLKGPLQSQKYLMGDEDVKLDGGDEGRFHSRRSNTTRRGKIDFRSMSISK